VLDVHRGCVGLDDPPTAIGGLGEGPGRGQSRLLNILENELTEGHWARSKLVAGTDCVDFQGYIGPVVQVRANMRIESGVGTRLNDSRVNDPIITVKTSDSSLDLVTSAKTGDGLALDGDILGAAIPRGEVPTRDSVAPCQDRLQDVDSGVSVVLHSNKVEKNLGSVGCGVARNGVGGCE